MRAPRPLVLLLLLGWSLSARAENPVVRVDTEFGAFEIERCTQTSCPMRAAFGSTPLDSPFGAGSVVEPQDVLPDRITLDVTRAPEPAALAGRAAALETALVWSRLRSRA